MKETPATEPLIEIPDKLYFRIGEVTRLTGVADHVLRFWESEFSCIRPKRTESGQRLYRKSDIQKVFLIKHLLREKRFTIEGAKRWLKKYPDMVPADISVQDRLKTEILPEIKKTLLQIKKILETDQ